MFHRSMFRRTLRTLGRRCFGSSAPQLGFRTHDCGSVSKALTDQSVVLSGWVQNKRILGRIVFISLRDAFGTTQIVFDGNEEAHHHHFDAVSKLPLESVVKVHGTVRERPDDQVNLTAQTGSVEVELQALETLNRAPSVPPMFVNAKSLSFEDTAEHANEETRLRNRYLDLRGAYMQRNLRVRSAVSLALRNYLGSIGFIELETPTLFKSTPEGAREFLVPTRVSPGKFYALPQSPQQYKQMLMAGGFDRYFQFARCYRDEGTRSDRQPEFTQLDMEMAFVEAEDIMQVVENAVECMWPAAQEAARQAARAVSVPSALDAQEEWAAKSLPKPLLNSISAPFPRRTYAEVIEQYGSDKPDTRYDVQLQELGRFFQQTTGAQDRPVSVHGFVIKGLGAKLSRKECEGLVEKSANKIPDTPFTRNRGLAAVVVDAQGRWGRTSLVGQLAKQFFPKRPPPLADQSRTELFQHLNAEPGDLVLLAGSGDLHRLGHCWGLGEARVVFSDRAIAMGLMDPIDERKMNFMWVVDFPMFELEEGIDEVKLKAVHHPFTAPTSEFVEVVKNNTLESVDALLPVRGQHYDLVCNGVEVGGGSIRIHDATLQKHVLDNILHLSDAHQETFVHLLNALSSGCPPHGGLAIGYDRLMSMICDTNAQIRDVIAFPKTASGQELMTGSPNHVAEHQLGEYHIDVVQPK